MEEIRVNKDKLVEVITKNRAEHKAEFDKAMELYHRDVVETLQKALHRAKNGESYQTHFKITEPKSYDGEYGNVLGMLELSIDEEILLSLEQCKQYLNNEWNWTHMFDTTNAFYAQKFAG